MTKSFLILYGSVTGKAQSIAELIHRDSESKGFESNLICLSELDTFDLTNESCVVFVSSTTGDGEQPENARPFYNKLCKVNLPFDYLSGLQYTILGLGDTNYSQFCNGPKTLNKRLVALGAKTFYDPGWADDGTGLEIVVEPWIDGLWDALTSCPFVKKKSPKIIESTLIEHIELKSDKMDSNQIDELLKRLDDVSLNRTDTSSDDLHSIPLPDGEFTLPSLPATFLDVTIDQNQTKFENSSEEWNPKYPLATSNVFHCPITKTRQLTKDGACKRALEVTLDLKGTNITCEPGDSISLICPNQKVEVDILLNRLGYGKSADSCCTISLSSSAKKSAKIPDFFPPKFSLRELFMTCLDIRSVPKKPLLRLLCEHTSDSSERRYLSFLCSRQGSDVYLERVRGPNLCLLDLLITFPSCNPPIERLIEQLPRLQPRPYSVASHDQDGSLVDIVFNVVQIPAGQGRKFSRTGLCTGWIQELVKIIERGEVPKVPLFGRQNKNFRLPEKLSRPFIMIGPGTGVAPFRGFLQKQRFRRKVLPDGEEMGDAWLFFGCRNQKEDFLYESELKDFVSDGILQKFFTSFSREESKIRYVQDSIRENREDFIKLLFDEKNETVLFVCGDAKNMAKDVNETIVECTANVLGIAIPEARNKVADLVIQGRYLQDVWT